MGGGDGRRGAGGRLNHGGRWQCGEPGHRRAPGPRSSICASRGSFPGRNLRKRDLADLSLRSWEHGFQQRPLHYRLRAGRQFGISRHGTPRPDRTGDAARPRHPGKADRRATGRAGVPNPPLSRTCRGGERVRCPVGLVRRAGHRFLREALDEYPVSADLPRVRVSGIRRDPAGSLSRELREADFDETRPDLSPRVSAGADGQPVQGRASIRVDICSSNFPNFDINPNTGDPNDRRPRIAANTVYHDAGHASYIELPVDRPEDKP